MSDRLEGVSIRPMTPDDLEAVQETLYLAIGWNSPEGLPELETAMLHPEMGRYHHDWGRPGDAGWVAEHGGRYVAGVYYRLFTSEDHGHGYVADDVPELAIGVVPNFRGHGLGRRLMERTAAGAREQGFRQLSLSVDNSNSASRLYSSLGYQTIQNGDGSQVMTLDLA